MPLTYLRLTKLTASVAYVTIFMPPIKILLSVSLLAAACANLFQSKTYLLEFSFGGTVL